MISERLSASSRPLQPTVLLLVSGLGVGGAERLVLQLARGLADQGWRPLVVGLESDVELLEQFETDGLSVDALKMTRRPLDILRGLGRLLRIVRRERVDLIHAHLFHSLAVSYLLRLRSPRVRIVFTSHNYAGFSPLRAAVLRWTRPLRHADVLLGSGQHPRLNKRRAVVIPNGVEVYARETGRVAREAAAPTRFLYLGRLTAEKNVDRLILAIAEIDHRRARGEAGLAGGAQLWIAGDGPMRAELERIAAQSGVGPRVRFLGMQARVRPLLEQCEALVMASDYEGLPMAVLEAGEAAMPVIAPPVGSLPELLGERCGYLVTPDHLVEAMLEVIRDPQESARVGARLRQRIDEGFSMSRCLERHVALYREVLA